MNKHILMVKSYIFCLLKYFCLNQNLLFNKYVCVIPYILLNLRRLFLNHLRRFMFKKTVPFAFFADKSTEFRSLILFTINSFKQIENL